MFYFVLFITLVIINTDKWGVFTSKLQDVNLNVDNVYFNILEFIWTSSAFVSQIYNNSFFM